MKKFLKYCGVALLIAAVLVMVFLPNIGSAILLHPTRKPCNASPPAGCKNVTCDVDGVRMEGWRGKFQSKARGTVIYLHGMADNRAAGVVNVVAALTKEFRHCESGKVNCRHLKVTLIKP